MVLPCPMGLAATGAVELYAPEGPPMEFCVGIFGAISEFDA